MGFTSTSVPWKSRITSVSLLMASPNVDGATWWWPRWLSLATATPERDIDDDQRDDRTNRTKRKRNLLQSVGAVLNREVGDHSSSLLPSSHPQPPSPWAWCPGPEPRRHKLPSPGRAPCEDHPRSQTNTPRTPPPGGCVPTSCQPQGGCRGR